MNLRRLPGVSMRQRIHDHRIAISVVAIVLLLVGGYAFWSKHTWNEYEARYEKWHVTTKDQINTALVLPATAEKERLNKSRALKKASDDLILAKASLCHTNSLVAWQKMIETLHDLEVRCQKMVDASAVVGQKIQATIIYLEHEQALVNLIKVVPAGKSELPETDWQAQATAWHEVAGKVSALSSDKDFAPTKQTAIDAISKVDTAWQEVLAAHSVKDKPRYIKAQTQLANAYSSFDAIAVTGAKQIKTLIDPLQAAYKDTF